MITENQYLEAKRIIDEYQNQLKKELFEVEKENFQKCIICGEEKPKNEFNYRSYNYPLKRTLINKTCKDCEIINDVGTSIRMTLNKLSDVDPLYQKMQKIDKILGVYKCFYKSNGDCDSEFKCIFKKDSHECRIKKNRIKKLIRYNNLLWNERNNKITYFSKNSDILKLKVIIHKLNLKLKNYATSKC